MIEKKRILVFPCGSEIALEIHRALIHSIHFDLIGANSVEDHGHYVYERYIGNVPYVTDNNFISSIQNIVKQYKIDAIYPAMDSAITILKANERALGCRVISSPSETTEICLSKEKTYNLLKTVIRTPLTFDQSKINSFPIFVKPKIGYSSRGCTCVRNIEELSVYKDKQEDFLFCEYLPGIEYTVDCFTDRHGKLLFSSPRIRKRISNGISVATQATTKDVYDEVLPLVQTINKTINFRGAWFAQFKRSSDGKLCLLEIASRFGGSSALFRGVGVNFAQLTLFDAFDMNVKIIQNQYQIEMDRALDNKYKIKLSYDEVFVDFDDCIIIDKKKVNTILLSFLYQCLNNGVKISLLSRHDGDLIKSMKRFRIHNLFDRIIHITSLEKKSQYIDNKNAIFIDDSFSERKDVFENSKIPVFSVDMIECLMQ